MEEKQIKEYLQKFRITSKEQLATHIEELKRNTVPNTSLISELVYVLEEDSFFRAPHTIDDFMSFPMLKNEGVNEGLKTHTEGVNNQEDLYIKEPNSLTKEEQDLWLELVKSMRQNIGVSISDTAKQCSSKNTEKKAYKETEGIKESNGKVDYSEINLEILDLMAERFTANKHKYPKGNMKKTIDIKSLEWALFRHVKKMIQPIETDEETYKDHLSAVLCNASMILDQLKINE